MSGVVEQMGRLCLCSRGGEMNKTVNHSVDVCLSVRGGAVGGDACACEGTTLCMDVMHCVLHRSICLLVPGGKVGGGTSACTSTSACKGTLLQGSAVCVRICMEALGCWWEVRWERATHACTAQCMSTVICSSDLQSSAWVGKRILPRQEK